MVRGVRVCSLSCLTHFSIPVAGSVDVSYELELYGLLMRAVSMHRAQVTLITPFRSSACTEFEIPSDVVANSASVDQWVAATYAHVYIRQYRFNLEVRTELAKRLAVVDDDFSLLNIHTAWRGSLTFCMDSDGSPVVTLPGIALVRDPRCGGLSPALHLASPAMSEVSADSPAPPLASQSSSSLSEPILSVCDDLRVVQAVDLSSVPPFLFSPVSFRMYPLFRLFRLYPF